MTESLKKSMNALNSVEAIKLKECLELHCNKSVDFYLSLNTAITNSLAVREPLDFNDPVVKHSVETIDKAIKNASHTHPVTILFQRLQKMFPQ